MCRLQEFDGASRGNPGPAGAGATLLEGSVGSQVCIAIMLPVALCLCATVSGQL